KLLQDKVKTMSGQIDSTIQTVRRISTELRPGVLDDLGLVAAIEWHANEFQTRTGVQCQFTTTVKEPILDQSLNTAFFRIFQETLTNIIRHASATKVEVSLTEEGGKLVLEVKDDGRGITEGEISNTKSIGLVGMRERAALLNGEVLIKGTRGKGTTVTVQIPRLRATSGTQLNHENPHRRRSRGSAARVEASPC